MGGERDSGRIDGVRKIAVLRGGALGDLLLALPAIRALAAAYPEAETTLLGSAQAEALLQGRPGAPDRVIVLPEVPGVGAPDRPRVPGSSAHGPEPEVVARFEAAARAEHYDLAVQLHGGGRFSNPFLLALGARRTIGTRTPDAAALDRSIDYVYFQHEIHRWLEVAGLAGARPVELEPSLAASAEEVDAGRRITGISEPMRGSAGTAGDVPIVPPNSERFVEVHPVDSVRSVVAVHPGATDPRRRWPEERFGEVCAALAEDGSAVAVLGSEEEAPLCARVVREAERRGAGVSGAAAGRSGPGAGPLIDLGGRLDLGGLVGVLAVADLLVGNDSGPRHLAQALGTATASVFWCGNLINAGPLTRERHRVQVAWTTRCPVCGRDCTQVGWTAERCEHDVSFVADVPVAAVLADARSLLARTR